jgi:AraC-like DNA-binding protein
LPECKRRGRRSLQQQKHAMDQSPRGPFFFDTDTLPARERFPMYCEEIGRRYIGLDFRTHDQSRFHATLALQRVGPVDVVFSSNVAMESVRTPGLVRDGDDSLCVALLESGSGYHTQCGGHHEVEAQKAIVCDAGYAGAYNLLSDARFWALRIPRSELAKRLPHMNRFAGVRLDENVSAERLLFGYVRAVFDAELSAGSAADLCGEHIVDLVALALGAGGDAREIAEERGARAARRAAVLNEIELRSSDPSLSVNAVASALGITPRYVHLLLEQTGCSFSHHVLAQRLEAAAALLRDTLQHHRKIADIAAEAGFADLSHFNRSFRRHFGATPSDIREAADRAARLR